MKNITNILGIILVVLIIIFIIAIIMFNMNPEKKEKQELNNKLRTDQMLSLLKYAQYHLAIFDNYTNNPLTDEYMILFGLDYMQVFGGYESITPTDEYIIAKRSDIEKAIEYVFDRKIDYSKVTFKVTEDSIFVPIYPIGTDAQIYKFRSREYNEQDNTYTVYIDCLEVGTSMYSEIIEGNVTEYNKSDVRKTLVFKYKVINERKVLVAYNLIINRITN